MCIRSPLPHGQFYPTNLQQISLSLHIVIVNPQVEFCYIFRSAVLYAMSRYTEPGYTLYNMWDCVFSVYPFPSWLLREYTYFVLLSSSNRKMNYYPLFRVRSWNNGMRCMSFYVLITLFVCNHFLVYTSKRSPAIKSFNKLVDIFRFWYICQFMI